MVVNISAGNRILCTFLLLLCCLLCAAGDEIVTLQEVEGTTITLHTGITGIQSDAHIQCFYGPEKAEEKILISQVFKGETVTEISERFKERLQLDRISGALTIRNISRNLSGVYLLQVLTEHLSSRTFSVSVYAPVSAPVIRNQRGKRSVSSTEPCFLLCSVENGEDVKLSWYRENERISITNNTDLSVPLNLTLQIQHPENNTHTCICVSANPVSNETTSLNITQFCNYNSEQTDRSLLPVLISAGLLGLLIIILAFVWIWLKNKKQKVSETEELTYADVKISAHSAESYCEQKLVELVGESDATGFENFRRDTIRASGYQDPQAEGEQAALFRAHVLRGQLMQSGLRETQIFSSVGGSSVQEVIGAVGESFTFHTSVPVSGNLIYKSDTVVQVFNKYSDLNLSEKFVNRLHWDGQSGFFTLTDLRTEDSGLYTVESTKEVKGKQDYQLEVYERVSAPQVVNTSSNSSEFCSLLCSVRNVRGLKLFWSKENDVLLNYTSSSNSSNITLSLHLEIKTADIHTFSCVASNPVSNEATTITITDYCSLNSDVSHQQRTVIVPVVVSVLLVVLVIVTYVYLRRKKLNGPCRRKEDSSATEGLNEEVQYSEINHNKRTQGNIPERISQEACPLTTIYDQLRPERTADCSNRGTE
ncbi:uncharacterized protein LOC132882602 [Neoarius graeffei]|uniref:uncharacterized protein LOC132882602 n=1 Tax=Neoarius graeffei TaxID=443677 RepID=UPI00298D042D|nr:uncharacterized protein LOC132882602 [Neoarius graeffei]